MTLLIYAKCKDASIVISDRKETSDSGHGQFVKKYHLSKNHDFFLAFSGEGDGIDVIITKVENDESISNSNVIAKLDQIAREITIPVSVGGRVASGCLLIKNNSLLEYRDVSVFIGTIAMPKNDPDYKSIGADAATSLADFLLRKSNIGNEVWPIACQKAVSIMKNVADIIDTVGRLEQYGFDVFVFPEQGNAKYCKYKETGKPEFTLEFDLHDPGVFSNKFKDLTNEGSSLQ